MESIHLGMLIVGVIFGIGVIELVMWIVVVIRNPGWDYLRPDLSPHVTPAPPEDLGTSRATVS